MIDTYSWIAARSCIAYNYTNNLKLASADRSARISSTNTLRLLVDILVLHRVNAAVGKTYVTEFVWSSMCMCMCMCIKYALKEIFRTLLVGEIRQSKRETDTPSGGVSTGRICRFADQFATIVLCGYICGSARLARADAFLKNHLFATS